MDKAEFESRHQEMFRQQSRFFEDNPEIRKWVETKKILFWVLAGYWIVHWVVSIIIMIQMQNLTAAVAGIEIFKMLFQLLWMKVFLNHMGSWRLNIMLYVSAVYNGVMLIQNGRMVLESISYFPYMSFGSVLLYCILIGMEVLAPLLLLAVAIYLTVPSRHRKWSEQVEAMYKETTQVLQDTVK